MTDGEHSKATSPYGSPSSAGLDDLDTGHNDDLLNDIKDSVQRALGRFGSPGEVIAMGHDLVLREAPEVRLSIASWLDDWNKIPESSRERRAHEAARRLAPKSERPGTSTEPARVIRFDPRLLLAIVFLCGVGAWLFFFEGSASRGARARSGPQGDGPAEQGSSQISIQKDEVTSGRSLTEARSSRVCRATLERIFRGGSVSVADVDGWVVEIAFAKLGGKQPLDTHPALHEFVADPTSPTGSRFIWKEQADLAPLLTSDTVVRIKRSTLGQGKDQIPGVVFMFEGTLVDGYFKDDGRRRYAHVAHALSEKLQATHVAVYARCFDTPIHALGGWFQGLSAGDAAAALVYFMGTFANPSHLARPFERRPGDEEINRHHAFLSIVDKTRLITRKDLATLVGQEGGMATGKSEGPVTITFPFSDGNRASRSSRSIARVTKLGY